MTLLFGAVLTIGQSVAKAATYTVTTTNDTGAGSLRAAITSANGAVGADTIRFNIGGAGVRTITLASALPTITDQVLIDGYTQPGSSVNTVDPGSNAVLRIELNGNNAIATGFTINTFHCYIRGLVINRFTTNSINIAAGADNARIQGNFIGTNAAGTAASGTGNGIVVFGANSQIGGWGGDERNQVSGCTTSPAIRLSGAACTGTEIRVNNIGLSSDGTTVIGGVQVGLRAENGSTQNMVGETGCCYNQIAGCTNQGIVVADAATRLDIKGNYIWGNGGLGIDLANNGITTNDVADADTGPNHLTNFPVLVNAMSDLEGRVYVDFTYNGTPSTWIRFDFYANTNPDATHGEGQLWIGTRYFETSPSGTDLFHATVGAWNGIPAGTMISCTATNEGHGATSEYAANLACTGQKFMVTNTNDLVNGDTSSVRNLMYNQGGDGVSLREAILAANNNYDGWTANYIYFDLPGPGAQTITPTSPLPCITTATYVMGYRDPEYSTTPVVRLSGTSAGAGANGIVFDWGWGGIFGFSITGFGGNAITVNAASTEVNYCHLGVAPDGVTCAGNGGAGVYVNNTPDTEIGNPWWPGSPNVISGNAAGGIIIDGSDAERTRVCNSRIGTNQAGMAAICSQPFGVSIRDGAHDNFIGSENATMENVISGHPQHGVIATGNGNEVGYSFIGTNLAGTAAIPNGMGGINMTGADTYVHHNTISGNTGSGITLNGDAATVDANFIGTNKTGTTAVPNTQYGLVINACNACLIGDGLLPTRNIISGNSLDGIYLNSTNVHDMSVRGNYIGLGADGNTVIANQRDGIRLNAARNVLMSGNAISGNVAHGVHVIGGDGMNLTNNRIGTNNAGTLDRGNTQNGVNVVGSSNILVGTDIAQPNIISGNNKHGVELSGAATTFPQILGNHIGLNMAGTAAIANTQDGIHIGTGVGVGRIGAPGSYINIISGNTRHGLLINSSNGQDIRSNRIGTNATGNAAVPNGMNGIRVVSCANTLIGGAAVNEGNLVSGNTAHGIELNAATGTVVKGNLIGTNRAGTSAIANANDGFWSTNNTTGSIVGGTTTGERNVFSGNGWSGLCHENGANTISIQGNYVGLGSDGSTAIPNAMAAVYVGPGCSNIGIGSTTTGGGNVISGNSDLGIWLQGSNCMLWGNHIGTDATGSLDRGNGNSGILVEGAGHVIGGSATGTRNLISGNGNHGIHVQGAAANGTIVRGNSIGTNAAGNAPIANAQSGIRVEDADNVIVGGSASNEGNLISGNSWEGISLLLDNATTVQGNLIGVNAAGTAAVLNYSNGIGMYNSTNALIGGNTAGARNVISGNSDPGATSDGIYLTGASSNTIQGNYIGTNGAGSAGIANYAAGIACDANNNLIGGTGAGEGNLIAFNGTQGVRIGGSRNRILGNAIHSNGTLGIDLASDGVTANDAGDVDSGANTRQNFPVLSSVNSSGGNTTISGTLNSAASTTYRIEFFSSPTSDASGYGEGMTYIGSANVTTDGGGNAVFNITLSGTSVVSGHVVTSTATHSVSNNSSEFSQAISVTSGYTIAGTVFEDVNYGGGAGRDRGTALANGGSGRQNARVELYDAAGNYLTFTSTDAAGAYAFTGLAPANYTVRVSSISVSSGRVGASTAHIPVQTFRTNATTGTAVPVTNYVGGEVPYKIDTGSNLGPLAALTTATTTAQAITTVTLGASSVTGVDFGFNFNVVCNTNNAGQGSLRQVINQLNQLSNTGLAIQGRTVGQEHAIFMISNGTDAPGLRASNTSFTGGVASIVVATPLSPINFSIDLDATTQPGFAGTPVIELNGAATGAAGIGLEFTSAADVCLTRGFVINRFPNTGIQVNAGSNQHRFEGNYIGTDITGTLDRGNGTPTGAAQSFADGIRISGSGTVIGGATAAARNIISGNDDQGIALEGNNNVVYGNYIGTDVTGMLALPNGHASFVNECGGIAIKAGSFNVVGGPVVGQRNVISGNIGKGIVITDAPSSGNLVQGNYIGLNAAGTGALANTTHGITVDVTGAQYIGGFPGEGNVISGNTFNGIELAAVSATEVSNNIIGLNAAGTAAVANGRNGILFSKASSGTIISNNTISGNLLSGILSNPPSGNVDNVTIAGNIIGLNVAGASSIANGEDGIGLLKATNVIIGTNGDGTNDAAERNIISGNTDDGVEPNLNCSNIRIAGNYIGTDITGTLDRGNGQIGVHVVGTGVVIGTNADGVADAAERNIISGNDNCGISFIGSAATSNVVAGNWIGLNAAGTGPIANQQAGVRCMLGAPNNRIGTNADGVHDAAEPNVICASTGNGIDLFQASTGTTIAGNYIGIRPDGITAQGNAADGIHINATASNTIGGEVAAARNVIGSNGQDGIQVTGVGSSVNLIRGNYIGTTASGNTARPNGQHGVRLEFSANGCQIGGDVAGRGNVISGNTGTGIYVDQSALSPMILGNYIGLGADGTTDVGNGGAGVFCTNNSTGPTIGNGTIFGRNVISGNAGDGVHCNTGANFASIRGNYIGTNAAGNAAVPNLTGITIFNSNNHHIGGNTAALGNVIAGNTNMGIQLANGAQAVSVRSNLIGVAANGTSALGNGLDGLRLSGGASDNIIGDALVNEGNIIANSGFHGIRMEPDAGTGNRILRNSIRDNGSLGIDLHNDGPTPNDANDADAGANERQNYPVLTSAAVVGTDITIRGNLNSAPSTQYRVEFFSSPVADPSGFGEGATFIGAANHTTNASGTVAINSTFTGAPPVGHKITSTATKLVAGVSKSTSEFSGLITSTLPPVAICQDPTVYLNASGVATLTPSMSDNGSYDPDGTIVSMTLSQTNFTCADIGEVAAVLFVTDNDGAMAMCSTYVHVVDTIRPTITCPANINAVTTSGCFANVWWPVPTATDNCSGVTVVRTSGPATGFVGIGVHTVVYTATDASGNSSTCSFTVTVVDNIPPYFSTCQVNITTNAAAGQCAVDITGFLSYGIVDNCDMVMTQPTGPDIFAPVPIGIHNITLLLTDPSGNTATCSFVLTVRDVTPPTISGCPANISVNAGASCNATATWTVPTASDDCPGVTITRNAGPAPGSTFPVGTTTVTYTAMDAFGNTATCSFTVTVVDATAPVIVGCPSNITMHAGPMCTAIANWTVPTATDNCSGVTIVRTTTRAPGTSFPTGTTPVTYVATDASGNTTTCTFNVTVQDVTAPTITCPPNVTYPADPGMCSRASTDIGLYSSSSTCSSGNLVTYDAVFPLPVGVNIITWTATDNYGNASTCQQTVTITDSEVPVISGCPGNISVNAGAACTATATWTVPTFTDNCAGGTITRTTGPAPGSTFPIGTTTVAYTATDASGNTSTCTFTVTVVDVTAPTLVCPATINVNNEPGVCGAVVNYTAPVGTDNCSGATTIRTGGLASGSTFPIGTTVVTYQTTDAAGLVTTCSFNVVVNDSEAPTLTCPANISVNAAAGTCSAVVTYTEPIPTDNCGNATITRVAGPASGSTFPVGTTWVGYEITHSGQTNSCFFSVTVVDITAPVITGCPSNISVNTGAMGCSASATWTLPSFTDNCAGGTITRTAGPAPGSLFPVGTTPVTYTATDAAGNTATCSFTVTVVDVTSPNFIVCQSDFTVNVPAGECSVDLYPLITFTYSDNCGVTSLFQTSGTSISAPVGVGVHPMTFMLSDPAGNSATCSFTVTVSDAEAPAISCPANITVNNTPGVCGAVVNYTAPVGTDNCPGATTVMTAGLASGSTFPVGTTTVTYQVSDAAGLTASCSFTVTVNDTQEPVAVCQAVTLSLNGSGVASLTPAQVDGGSTDNCAITSMTVVPNSFNMIGTFSVTLTVFDAAGNSDDCTVNVTVEDNNAPTAVCQPVTIHVDAAGNASIVAADIDGGSTDNGTIVSLVASQTAFDCSDLGANNVTLTVTDDGGNTDNCVAVVTVLDIIPPTAICQNITVQLNSAGAATITAAAINNGSSDNCAITTMTASQTAFNCADLGANTVVLTVTDASGNSSTCNATVTIQDNIAPSITCPANISVNNDAGICGAVVNYTSPVGTDNCGGSTTIRTAGLASGSTFPVGVNTVTYQVTDAAGNSVSCSFAITVNDVTAPVISGCPSNISVNAGAGCTATATWTAPTFTDNCAGGTIALTNGLAPGSSFPIGTTTVTYTATDAAGNPSTCSFTVTVVDVTAPVFFGCPSNITVNAGADCTAIATWAPLTLSDNCPSAVLALTSGMPSGSSFPIDTTTVTYSGTDGAGNIGTCSFTVTVVDATAPEISCPAIIVASNDAGVCGAVVNYATPVGTDNCTGATTVMTAGIASGSQFPIGNTNVTYQVTDAAGLTASCSFTVTVNDAEAPVAICQAVSVNLDGSGTATITAADVNNGSTDNCAIVSMTLSQYTFPAVGPYAVTLTVTDAAGNSDDCTVTVTVTDNDPPIAECQPVTIYLDAAGNATIVAADIDGGSTDNGTIVNLVASQTSFDCSDLGANNVTLTVTDDGGNSDDCIANVTVIDTIAPTAVCMDIYAFLDASGNVTITDADLNGGTTDNCGTATLTFSASTASFDCSDLGPQTVTLTVTDASGNSSTCSAIVTVQDTIAPTLACADATINVDANGWAVITASAIATWSDNCSSGLTSWTSTDSVNVVGDTTIWVFVEDITGNIDSCSATVTTSDSNPPVAVCQPVTIYLDAAGNATIVAADIDGGSTDNGTIVSLVASQTSFDCSDLGANSVTLTVTDDGGNSDDCIAIVTVLDTIAPTVVCQDVTLYLNEEGEVTVGSLEILVSGTDNCSAVAAITSTNLIETAGVFNVSVTVSDQSGNSSGCTSTVTVLDTIRPVPNCNVMGGIVVYLDQNGIAEIAPEDLDAGSMDNDTIVSYIASQTIFDCSDLGHNPVTLTVTDAADNTATCTTVVTVLDTIAPTVICQNLTLEFGPDGEVIIDALTVDNGSWDNCGGNDLSHTTDLTSIDSPGVHTIVLTVTDASGNASTCMATITVEDNTPPDAVCQPTTIYLDANGNASIEAADIDGGSSDNDSLLSIVASQTAFDCGDLGPNNVNLTVTDAFGNTDACVAIVTVRDTIAPVVACQDITVNMDANGNAMIDASTIVASSSDNCGNSTLTYTATTTTFTSAGAHTVVLTVTDASGNSSSCIATITVIANNLPPVAVCQPVTIYLDANGNASITPATVEVGSSDDIGIVNMIITQSTFGCNDLGENLVTLTVFDAAGANATCQATVTVLDTIAPVVSCASITITLNEQDEASITAVLIDGGSHDNCGITEWSTSVEHFTTEGTYSVELTVTDASGNSSMCTATVTVQEPKDELKIPSGFSPNGDGIADTWVIQGLEEYPDNSVLIFNRWGTKIHEQAPYLNDWTGISTASGTLPGALPAGTYFYVVELGEGEGARTGYIQINR